MLCLVTAIVAAVFPLIDGPSPTGTLGHTELAVASQFPGTFAEYSPPELWGGGNPAETCFVCNSETADGVGTTAASVDPNSDVTTATGEFTTNYTVFDSPGVGPDFKFELSYSSRWAQAQQASPGYSGVYGWGWGSNLNVGASSSGGNVTINDVNGSQLTFDLPGYQDSCNPGDYEDTQKYTFSWSSEPYCAPQRVDAQLGYAPLFGAYEYAENGQKQTYVISSLTGSLISIGNANNDGFIQTGTSASPGTGGCPSTSGITSCIITTDSAGRKLIQALDAYWAVEVIDPSGNQYLVHFSSTVAQEMTGITNAAHSNALTQYGYWHSGGTNQENLGAITDPNSHLTYILYTGGQGFVYQEADGLGNVTTYNYANTLCPDPSCTGNGQTQVVTVHYPDGETDVDHYYEGLLTSSSFGNSSSSDVNFQTWTYNYTFPSPSNQDGDTVETIVHPGAALGTSQVTQVTTDSVGNVLTSQDVNGNTTLTMYNDTGANDLDEMCWSARPGVAVSTATATCSSPPTGSTYYTYDQSGNELTMTDPMGNTTRYGYYSTPASGQPNLEGKLCWEAPPTITAAGSTCSNGPNGAPAGSTTYTYDSAGDLTNKTVDSGGAPQLTTQSGYNTAGQVTWNVPPEGQGAWVCCFSNPYMTTYSYYAWGALQTTTAPDAGAVTNYYDAADNLIMTLGSINEYATYGYNADDQRCWSVLTAFASGSCSSPPANSTVTTYEPGTNAPSAVKDPKGNTTSYYYADPAYPTDPTEVADPAGSEITWRAYDAFGNACVSGPVMPALDTTSQCNVIAGDTANQYDAAGDLLASWDANGLKTSYGHGNAGYDNLVTSSTNPQSQTTNYGYDNDGRLIETSEPNGSYVAVGYDADSRKCSQAPVNAAIACGASAPSGSVGDSTYAYDGASEIVSMQDNRGTTGAPPATSYTYTNGDLTRVSDDNAKVVSYLYGYGGEVLCIAYPIGTPSCGTIASRGTPSSSNAIVNYGYDTAMRATSVTPWLGTSGANSVTYSYGDNYNPTDPTQISYPTTSTAETLTYNHDTAGNLQSAAYAGPVLNGQSDQFTYNADEQVQTSSLLGAPASPSVSYNSYKQIQSAENPGQTSADTYQIKPNGEITSDSGPTGTTSFNYNFNGGVCWTVSGTSSNSCGTAPTGATTFSYDSDGQRAGSTNGTTSTSYGWNAFGQLCWAAATGAAGSACSSAPSGATQYAYSGDGLRMSATTSSTTSDITWDTVRGGTVPLDISDGSSYYIYGPLLFGGTAPIEQITGGWPIYLASTPSGVQDAFTLGIEVERASYSLYGIQTITSGTKISSFGYQGSYSDATGLMYLINRYYDPSTAQFLSIDPKVAETGQPYAYAADDPLNSTDPLGLTAAPHAPPKTACANQGRNKKACQKGIAKQEKCGRLGCSDAKLAPKSRGVALVVIGGIATGGVLDEVLAGTTVADAVTNAVEACSKACRVAAKFAAAETAAQGTHAALTYEESRTTDPNSESLYRVSGDLLDVLSGIDFAHDVGEAGGGH